MRVLVLFYVPKVLKMAKSYFFLPILPPGQQSSHNPNNGGSVGGFESAFPTNWDNPAGNNHYRGSSPAGWASNWPNNSAASKNGGSNQKAPINPFTGTTYSMITIEWALVGPSFTQENILLMFLVQRWRT
jgi:hypothetical protein